ncbi:hypothetical protein ACTZWW_14585 [Salinarimonas sp. NSM]|uniref:hypothetical protein n=1 Tax=Salinarimonas sp. NSM TaxID=3458003 RepID=UPI004036D9EF
MTLDEFLDSAVVPMRATNAAPPELGTPAPVALECALLAQDPRHIVVERHGTTYEVEKADVLSIEMPEGPVVTGSRRGHPVRLVLRAETELLVVRRRRAADLEAVLPTVLARPSGAAGFTPLGPPAHAAWFRERGMGADERIITTTNTDSTSPSARHAETASAAGGRSGSWASDDVTAAGFATDEIHTDDVSTDDMTEMSSGECRAE